jgi:hypothetical protein
MAFHLLGQKPLNTILSLHYIIGKKQGGVREGKGCAGFDFLELY